MLNNKRKLGNLPYYALILVVIYIFGIVMSLLYRVSITKNGLVFSTFVVFAIFVPGYALANFLKISCKTDVEIFTYSLFLGYFLTFIEYFMLVPTGLQLYSTIIAHILPIISVGYIVVLYKKKKLLLSMENDISGRIICLLFFVVVLGLNCFTYAGTNLLPPAIEANELHNDCIYWIGNSIELTKHFPPYNFRNYPNSYNYHYFTSCQIAFTSLVTGIDVPLMSFAYSYIIPSAMVVWGAYCAFSRFTSVYFLRFSSIWVLLFTGGITTFTVNTYAHHMFVGQFAFDYGMGIFLFILYLVSNEYTKKATDYNEYIILFIMICLECGVKANFAAIAVAGVGLICVQWLFSKDFFRAIGVGIPILCAFILLYFSVTNIVGYSGSISREFINSHVLTRLYETLLTFRPSYSSDRLLGAMWIISPFYILIYVFCCHPLLFGIMGYQIVRAIKNKASLKKGSFILIACITICIVIRVFIGMMGVSEMYFAMNAFPLGIAFVLLNWETELKQLSIRKIGAIAILFAMSVIGNETFEGDHIIINSALKGMGNYLGNVCQYDISSNTYISKSQMDAYRWIKNNTLLDAVIATNTGRTLNPGVFTERYVVNEDDTFLFFETDDFKELQMCVSSMKERGVSYILCVKSIDNERLLVKSESLEGIAKVYENDESIIWQVE